MGAADSHVEAKGAHKILCLLDALRQSRTGAVIYRQVERMLDDLLTEHRTIERTYLVLVNELLEAYLGHLREGSALQVQVRLLQTRLQPPLSASDLASLRDYVELYASQIQAVKQLDEDLLQSAIEPLLVSFGISEGQPLAQAPAVVPEPPAAAVEPLPETPEPVFAEAPASAPEVREEIESLEMEKAPQPYTTDVPAETEAPPAEDIAATRVESEPVVAEETAQNDTDSVDDDSGSDAEGAARAESSVDTAYRSHLDSKHRDIQKLQSTLAEQVLGTIAQNEEFGVLLEVVLGELRQAGDGKELEDLRWTLIREIEKLTKGHHELAEQLDSTHHYLQLIESDSRQLNDELTRVRLLSLTDELTGLPNRRAFLRRIEDEVARVQRYGFPLSLALIDLDHFKQINDKYGHAGGDEVLQMYSKNILSIFRHHDLVARYGGEEFAVLLPNTDAEGSLRALTKVKNRAAETHWQDNGDMIPVPTFSSGVSLYKPGETASAFIERADKALYRAKRLGRNRVEMDATYQSGPESDASGDDGNPDDSRRQGES